MSKVKEISVEVVDIEGRPFEGDFELSDKEADFLAKLFIQLIADKNTT